MAVKVTVDLRNLNRLVRNVRKEFTSNSLGKIRQQIRSDILRGVSPVEGERFPAYSPSYKDAIRKGRIPRKSISPVNLKVTGDMLNSLYVIAIRNLKTIEIGFNDLKADFHNRLGAGRSKTKRRLLPTETGERFNRKIRRVWTDGLAAAVKKVVARSRR